MDATQLNRPQPLEPQALLALESLVATAATTLATTFTTTLRLVPIATFAYQPHIIRCQVQGAAADLPATVVIKQARNRGDQIYHPDDPNFWSLAYRLFNDWAGAQFLQAVSPVDHFGPRLFAGNREAGLIVLEDLGDNISVKHALLGNDAQQAETELRILAGNLGHMHAVTAGYQQHFEQVRDRLGPRDPTMYPHYAWYLQNSLGGLQTLMHEAGIEPPAQLTTEVMALATTLAEPGSFAVYTHGDPCPLNWLQHDTTLRLIDFEVGGFGPALLDAMHGRMLFPTFAFAQRIPPAVIERMEHRYRSELVKGCRAVADDGAFARATVEACAFWLVFCLIRDLKPALTAHDESAKTAGQCLIARLQAFLTVAAGEQRFSALCAVADGLLAKLIAVWSAEADALPYYPAFRQREQANGQTARSAT